MQAAFASCEWKVEQTVSFMDERIKFYEPFMASKKKIRKKKTRKKQKRNEIKETHNSKVAKEKSRKRRSGIIMR